MKRTVSKGSCHFDTGVEELEEGYQIFFDVLAKLKKI